MNWEIFSPIGYASIVLWLCMPLMWLLHMLLRQWGYLVHLSLVVGVVALVLGKINSSTYVSMIQVDRSQQIEEQMNRQQLARDAATKTRESEVAQIRFAEDGGTDFIDIAGMDDADLKYHENIYGDLVPDWKREKKTRSVDQVDESLESQIGAKEEQSGVESAATFEDEVPQSILMSDADKAAANKLDSLNLNMIWIMLGFGVLAMVVDYLSRTNNYRHSYFPLPLPSSWVNAFSARQTVIERPKSPRRSLLEELRIFARRGDSFVFITDSKESADNAARTLYRWPLQIGRVDVLKVSEFGDQMDDDFVFETVWFGRNSFVVDSKRGEQMLERFLVLLGERRASRARVRQTVHVIWDVAQPLPTETIAHFEEVGGAAGFSLLLRHGGLQLSSSPSPTQE